MDKKIAAMHKNIFKMLQKIAKKRQKPLHALFKSS